MSKNYLAILQGTPLKMLRISERMGMRESHLRYHLQQVPMDPTLEKKLLATVRTLLKETEKALFKSVKAKSGRAKAQAL